MVNCLLVINIVFNRQRAAGLWACDTVNGFTYVLSSFCRWSLCIYVLGQGRCTAV